MRTIALVLSTTLWIAACGGDKDPGTDTDAPPPDGDSDTDTDADADADADADTDSDTDADSSDTGTPVTTDTGDTGDTGTTAAGLAPVGDFVLDITGSGAGCSVVWDVVPTGGSYTCVGCPYTLDWAFDVDYTVDPVATDATGCNPSVSYLDYQILYVYSQLGYLTNNLNNDYHVWGFTQNYGAGTPAFMMGYGNMGMVNPGSLQPYPGSWDTVTGDFQFTDPYYGFIHGAGVVQ